ncbi:hypothetical protein SAMN03159494_03597 [Achromobacter sp. NFACC18-2]|nr:hypothetical protein SAMN03159494_03597 [Achromobacter sp. NFACC18-2]
MKYFWIWLIGTIIIANVPLGAPGNLEALLVRGVVASAVLALVLWFIAQRAAKRPRSRQDSQG